MTSADGINFEMRDGRVEKLNYKLWKAQSEAIKSWKSEKTDIAEMRGGFRSGKSIAGARAILMEAAKKPDSRWAVMADSYREGIRATFEVLFEQLPGYDGENPTSSPIINEYHKQDMILTLVNGSKILLSTSQKPDSLKGTELSGAWLDECAFYSDLYDLLRMVLSRMSADESLGIFVTTTTNGYNDYYHILEENIHPDSGEEISWNIDTTTADVRENPFLSDSVKERLERTHEGNEAMGLKGGFSASEGRVYDSFNRNDHIVKDANVKDDWRVYGMDFGWDDPLVVIEIGKTNQGQLVVLDEFYKSEAELDEATEWLSEKPSGTIYADWNPRQQEQIRRDTKHRVENAYKPIDDGIYAVKQRLKQKGGLSGLLVCERAKNTIQEFLGYTQDDVGGSNVEDHALDSLRYGIASPRSDELNSKDDRVKYAIARASSSGRSVETNNQDDDKDEDVDEEMRDATTLDDSDNDYRSRKDDISPRR